MISLISFLLRVFLYGGALFYSVRKKDVPLIGLSVVGMMTAIVVFSSLSHPFVSIAYNTLSLMVFYVALRR